MSNGLNRVDLIGNLVADAEGRNTPNGGFVSKFRIAVNWSTGSGDDKKEGVDFITCEKWNSANLVKYLTKGKQVYVEGRLKTDVVGEGDERKYYTKVTVTNLILLGAKRGDVDAGAGSEEDVPAGSEDEIPF